MDLDDLELWRNPTPEFIQKENSVIEQNYLIGKFEVDPYQPNCSLRAIKNLKFDGLEYQKDQEFKAQIKWGLGPTLEVVLENQQRVTLYVYDSYFENVAVI